MILPACNPVTKEHYMLMTPYLFLLVHHWRNLCIEAVQMQKPLAEYFEIKNHESEKKYTFCRTKLCIGSVLTREVHKYRNTAEIVFFNHLENLISQLCGLMKILSIFLIQVAKKINNACIIFEKSIL